MILITLGAIFGLLAVVIGAFGAHSFEDIIGDKMDTFKTAIQYQMFHSMALMITGLLALITKLDLMTIGYLFIVGILLFTQILIGIFTLLYGAQILIASMHQISSIFLVSSSIYLLYLNSSSNLQPSN